jgi:hypothetical protein
VIVIIDELKIAFMDNKEDVPLLNTEIAWPTDKEIKFRNPPGNNLSQGEFYAQSCAQFCAPQFHSLTEELLWKPACITL